MDLTALSGVDLMTAFQTPQVASKLTDKSDSMLVESEQQGTAVVSVFQSALNLIEEQKANVSLKYTVAVRDAVVDAYKEIMNMQF